MSAPLRIVARIALIVLLVWGFFVLAGRWDRGRGWAYIGILVAGNTITAFVLWLKNPELFRLRGRIGKGTKTWDWVCLPLFGLAIVAIMIVGALDAGRYQWSGMADWLWPVGLVAFMAGQVLLTGAMIANPFFEKTARIQKDRSHRVVDSGPYAHVRHPAIPA